MSSEDKLIIKKQPQECWTDLSFNKINIIRWQVNSKYDPSVSVSLKLPVNNGCSLVRLQPTQNTITGVTDLIQAYRTRGKPPTKWTDDRCWTDENLMHSAQVRTEWYALKAVYVQHWRQMAVWRRWWWWRLKRLCFNMYRYYVKNVAQLLLRPSDLWRSLGYVCNKIIVCLILSLDLLLLYSSKPFWIQFTLNRHIDSFMNKKTMIL